MEKTNWKNKNLNLAPLLYKPEVEPGTSQVCTTEQNHQLEKSLDCRELLAICKTAVAGKKPGRYHAAYQKYRPCRRYHPRQ